MSYTIADGFRVGVTSPRQPVTREQVFAALEQALAMVGAEIDANHGSPRAA
jgi:hypothetical protein